MYCIIIEDQPPAQRILKKYIEDIGTLELKATFSNPLQAMEFLKTEIINLIFLDIHLPRISGIDFLKTIPNAPPVILTTAFSEYALESYELNVVDYLLKPFSFQRFVKAVAKVPIAQSTEKSSNPLTAYPTEMFIKSGYEHIKITVADIIFIKSDADYTELHTAEKKYLSSEPLRYWSENLAPNLFFQIHKSYIINTSKILKVVSNQIHLSQDLVLPIGRVYKEAFTTQFLK